MFSIFESVVKVALSPVDLVVGVVADLATVGGITTDKSTSYTEDDEQRLVNNVKDITK